MSAADGSWQSLGRTGLPPVMAADGPLEHSTRVVILGEDALARAALADRLAGQHQLSVIAQLPVDAALAAVIEHEPDVVLWDLGLRTGGALTSLRTWDGGVPVLALSDMDVPAVDLHGAGTLGVLSRDTGAARLAAALVAVAHDLRVADAGAEPIVARTTPALPETLESLTPREREVVNLLAQGLSNKAIGEKLAISEHTAKFHVNAILGKLGASSRTDAVMRAVRLGLILI